MNRIYLVFAILLYVAQGLWAQEPIADNSFLIEEAYNQEPGVVQHISNLVYSHKSKDLEFSFTQEWPFLSQTHQLSYTVPYSSLSSGDVKGLGDVYLNYRYQALTQETWAAFSPRFSVILPTGNEKKNLGTGKIGYQTNLPFSRQVAEKWMIHANAGATMTPGVKTSNGKETMIDYHFGGSAIWLMQWNVNFMLEYLAVFEDDGTKHTSVHTISPGFRYAHNAGSLQIVPGIGLPIQLNGSAKTTSLFFYLSFEHPF